MSSNIISIYTTFPNKEKATKLSSYLIDNQFVACANYFPISSSYMWNGEIQNEEEVASLFKTTKEKWDQVSEKLEELHPYDIPCIIKYEIEANESYSKWVKDCVS